MSEPELHTLHVTGYDESRRWPALRALKSALEVPLMDADAWLRNLPALVAKHADMAELLAIGDKLVEAGLYVAYDLEVSQGEAEPAEQATPEPNPGATALVLLAAANGNPVDAGAWAVLLTNATRAGVFPEAQAALVQAFPHIAPTLKANGMLL